MRRVSNIELALVLFALLASAAILACGSPNKSVEQPSSPSALVVSSNGETLAIDTTSGAVRHLQGPLKDVWDIPSPDGAKLVIGCRDDGTAYIGGDDPAICMYTNDGYRQLSHSSDLNHPGLVEDGSTQLEGSWSPDSQKFAFLVRDRAAPDVYSSGDIYVVDLSSGAAHRIAEGEFAKLRGPLLWSPDGTHIATRNSPRLDGADELDVIDVATGALASLSVGAGLIEQYAWSPDSAMLAFTLNDGAVHLYTATADASQTRQLTTVWAGDAPVWSPDSKWIAADDVRGDFSTVFAIRADGNDRVELGAPLQRSSKPAWAPDSVHIAFSGSATADFNDRRLFLGDTVGNKPRQVTDETLAFFPEIAFSPEGKRLLYTANANACFEGCPPGYLFMTSADGSAPAMKLHDEPIEHFLGWLP